MKYKAVTFHYLNGCLKCSFNRRYKFYNQNTIKNGFYDDISPKYKQELINHSKSINILKRCVLLYLIKRCQQSYMDSKITSCYRQPSPIGIYFRVYVFVFLPSRYVLVFIYHIENIRSMLLCLKEE